MNATTPLHSFATIRNRSAEAVIGQSGLNHPGLAADLRRGLASSNPDLGALLQEPVIEAAPGYVEHDRTLGELAGGPSIPTRSTPSTEKGMRGQAATGFAGNGTPMRIR